MGRRGGRGDGGCSACSGSLSVPASMDGEAVDNCVEAAAVEDSKAVKSAEPGHGRTLEKRSRLAVDGGWLDSTLVVALHIKLALTSAWDAIGWPFKYSADAPATKGQAEIHQSPCKQ